MDAEGLSHPGFIGVFRHHHIPGSRTDALAEAVDDPGRKDACPGTGKQEGQLIQQSRSITRKGNVLLAVVFVADVSLSLIHI